MKLTIFLLIIATVGAAQEAPPPPEFQLDLVPAWASLTAGGNRSFLYQYSTIPHQFYGDLLGSTYRTPSTRELLFDGYWRSIDARSQTGFVEIAPIGTENYLRFWANHFEYFTDPTVTQTVGAKQNERKFKAHYAPGDTGPTFDLNVTDRTTDEPDIVRLRPGPMYDYRTLRYAAAMTYPFYRGQATVSFTNTGFDDKTGELPTSNQREFVAGIGQALTDRLSASLSFSDIRMDQTGLGNASLRSWALGASWLVAPRVTWRASGQLNRYSTPFTQTRYANHRDRLSTDVSWRPTREFGVQAAFTRRNLERIEDGSPITERPAVNDFSTQIRYRPGTLGLFTARYRNTRIVDPPGADILFLPSVSTLYYNHTQFLDIRWSRMFWDTADVYAAYRYSKRRNTERDVELRARGLNVGVSAGVTPALIMFLDFLWEDWDSNGSDVDPNGLNTGDDGTVPPGAASRLLFSEGQTITLGANYTINSQTWLDATAVVYGGHGGERNTRTFVAFDLRRAFLNGYSVGLGFQHEVFSDQITRGNDYDDTVFRITLSGKF